MNEDDRGQSESIERLGPAAWALKRDMRFTFVRSRGPGGQAVNKVNTAAQMRIAVSAIQGLNQRAAGRLRRLAGQRLTSEDELIFQAQTHRSQLDNRHACVQRLRELVTEALKSPKPRKKMKPTRAMIERRLAAKKRRAERKTRRRWKPES